MVSELLGVLFLVATSAAREDVEQLVVSAGGITRIVKPWGSDSVRVMAVPTGDATAGPAPIQAQALLAAPPQYRVGTNPTISELVVASGNIKVEIAAGPLPLATITRVSDGVVLLAETKIVMSPGPYAQARVDTAARAASSPPPPPPCTHCNSVNNIDFYGDDLPNGHIKKATSASECCSMCQVDPACNFWTYVEAKGKRDRGCWKKGTVHKVLSNADHTSGVKGCGPLPPLPTPSPPPAPPTPAIPTYTATVAFGGLGEGEGVYGLGEHRGSSRCDNQCVGTTLPIKSWDWEIQHSQDVHYLPNNGNAWIPFYQSSKGFGFLWNSAGYGHVHLGADAVRWDSNATLAVDYYVTTSQAPSNAAAAASALAQPAYRDVMRNYVQATGAPPTLPHEYTGFWQCKLRYSSQFQIERVANEYIQRKLPLSVIVVDYHHWVHEGDWRFSDDPEVPGHTTGCWPKPGDMVANVSALGVKVAVSVWPDVDTNAINYANMSARGMLIRDARNNPKPSVEGKCFVDAFNPDTRKYMFDQLQQGYGKYGIDTFWLDASEPEGANIGEWYYKLDDGKVHHDAEVAMAWPQQYHRMVYEGLVAKAKATTAAGGAKDAAMAGEARAHAVQPPPVAPFLTRSAFAGSQRYGAILWSGDIESSFNELAVQVQVAQHVAMSGIYLWTTDIGGFRNGDPTEPSFRQLIVRWFQFGAFCPIFRLHGDRGGPKDKDVCASTGFNEVWTFGETAYSAISDVMRLRESLRPYVQTQIDLSSSEGTPSLRPMVFDFVDDACADAVDQFMFGPDWLVAPVLELDAVNRTVYLPALAAGETWSYHYNPSLKFEQPGWVTVDTKNISQFPLFHRQSSS